MGALNHPHPAKYSAPLLPLFREELQPLKGRATVPKVLDPFAGTGRIHELYPEFFTVGVELEPKWAASHPRTWIGNALSLPAHWNEHFDAVVTSPTYGNRMADHHDAKDGSKRMTYRHQYGEPLQPENSGMMQWGGEYRAFHHAAWCEVHRVLRVGGMFLLNISNHVRRGSVVPVSEWHRDVAGLVGFEHIKTINVPTARMGFGANRAVRVDHEDVHLFIKPNPKDDL